MEPNRILFFLPLVLLVLLFTAFPVSSGLSYYDFYQQYIVNTYPAKIISKNVNLTGSEQTGLGFITHSRIIDIGNNYTHLEWKGIVYYTDTVPVISFSFRVMDEHLIPREGFAYADYTYSILSMTHWRDLNNALVLVVKINPEADPTHTEYIYIRWLYAKFDPNSGFSFTSDSDAGTDIALDGGTLYSHSIRITIIPVIYSWNTTNTVRALFGFYTIVVVDENTRTDFQVAWREVFFDKYNVTEFHRYVQSFYKWYICLGTGSFLYRSDVNEVVYDVVYASSVDTSQSYIEIMYKNIYVANAELDINRYFNDWLRGLLPEYEPKSIIDLRSKIYGMDPGTLIFMIVSVSTSSVMAFIGYRFSRSSLFAFLLAVAGLTIAVSLLSFRSSILIVAGLTLILPFMRNYGGAP